MRKFFFALLPLLFVFAACDKTPKVTNADIKVALQLDGEAWAVEGITVSIRDLSSSASFEALTDAAGEAAFTLPAGLYEASASYRTSSEGNLLVYNGINSSIAVTAGQEDTFIINLAESTSSQILIKELYVGGCPKDDGSGAFQNDCYVILYNNSDQPADASDICFAFSTPLNSNSTSKYLVDGELSYLSQGWQPAAYAIWWFETPVTIEPYSQIVVSMYSSIDNTATYSNSVDLSDGSYYAMYDPESGFSNTTSYPAPSDAIPTSHYLKTYRYGLGNAWALSRIAPAFFILSANAVNISSYVQDTANYDYTDGPKLPNVKVPQEWIVDAVDVFRTGYESTNGKRFGSTTDAGYVYHANGKGYSIYRNVDKEATEALQENEGKIVYGYAGGTVDAEGNTDPSGIDAEASIANGAHILYKDTNNSTNDFHQRNKASLKK